MQKVVLQSEDMLLKYAVTVCAETDGKALMEENAKLKAEQSYSQTEKDLKTLRKALKKKQRTRSAKRKNIAKFVCGYAAVTAVLVSGFVMADAFHEPLIKFLTGDTKAAVYFNVGNSNLMEENIHVDWKNIYLPQYLPAGTIVTSITNQTTKSIGYTVDDKNIDFTQYGDTLATLTVDNEGVNVEKIEEKDFEANCSSKNNVTNIVWKKEGILFLLTGPTDLKAEMIKMARSVTYVE